MELSYCIYWNNRFRNRQHVWSSADDNTSTYLTKAEYQTVCHTHTYVIYIRTCIHTTIHIVYLYLYFHTYTYARIDIYMGIQMNTHKCTHIYNAYFYLHLCNCMFASWSSTNAYIHVEMQKYNNQNRRFFPEKTIWFANMYKNTALNDNIARHVCALCTAHLSKGTPVYLLSPSL